MNVYLFNRITSHPDSPEEFSREIRATSATTMAEAREKSGCDNSWDCVSMSPTVASFRAVMSATSLPE